MRLSRSMANKALTIAAAGFAIVAIPVPSTAQEEEAAEVEASETPIESDPIEGDMVFVAEEDLTLSAASSDDVFAAGGTIVVRDPRADHLFLAGGEITVSGATAQDLIAAGGEIQLNNATIIDDVIAAGGDISVAPSFGIGGSAVLVGGNVKLDAPVGGDLRIGAGEVFVNSAVTGTARLSGDKITIGPNARIGGDLLYRSENLTVDPGAVIEGKREILPMPDHSTAEEFGKGVGQLFLLFGLSILLSYFVLVAVLVLLAPGLMRSASTMMHQRPWQSLGIGFLYALFVPALILLLLTTIFAAPLAILLIAVSVALTPIALAVSAYFLGMSARKIATGKSEPPTNVSGRFLWPMLGVLVLFALTLIPLVGVLVWLLAMLFGLGAFAKQAGTALTSQGNVAAA